MKQLEFTISVKRKRIKSVYITNTGDACLFVKKCFDKNILNWREQLIVVCINPAGKVAGWYKIAEGAADQCLFSIQSIFQVVLLSNCSRFLLAHNHPSGSPKVSSDDIKNTKYVKMAAKMIGLELVDHFIVAGKKVVRIKK